MQIYQHQYSLFFCPIPQNKYLTLKEYKALDWFEVKDIEQFPMFCYWETEMIFSDDRDHIGNILVKAMSQLKDNFAIKITSSVDTPVMRSGTSVYSRAVLYVEKCKFRNSTVCHIGLNQYPIADY